MNTDATLYGNQIAIDYALQKKIDVERKEQNELAISTRPFAFWAMYWLTHPDERVRVPLQWGAVGGLISLSTDRLANY
jgi:hypothetical protein